MKIENGVFLLVLGVVIGLITSMLIVTMQADYKVTTEEVYKVNFIKDQLGNCYANVSNTSKFSWIPCELTRKNK